MSKHETWRLHQYWQSVGGLLIEEFQMVKMSKNKGVGRRLIDGLIILGEQTRISAEKNVSIENREVIAVQVKKKRLGMNLMGQAYFSKQLLEKYNPKLIRTVAICGKNDAVLEALCVSNGIEVVVIPESAKGS